MDGARGELLARSALADRQPETTEGGTCSINARTFCMSSRILVVEDEATSSRARPPCFDCGPQGGCGLEWPGSSGNNHLVQSCLRPVIERAAAKGFALA
jgi:hypothetical protein